MIDQFTRPALFTQACHAVMGSLERMHTDLGRIATVLGDPARIVWTVVTPGFTYDDGGPVPVTHTVDGWREQVAYHYRLINEWNTANRADVDTHGFTDVATAIDNCLATLPTINQDVQTVLDNYRDGNGDLISKPVTQTDRDSLAASITAQLVVVP